MTDQDFSGLRQSLLCKPLGENRSPAAPGGRRPAIRDATPSRAAAPELRDILNSIGTVVYDWDLLSDRISWGANAGDVLRHFAPNALRSGQAFCDLLAPQSESTRLQAILRGLRPAGDEGASYRAQYGLIKESGAVVAVEDFGRWFADASGRPARAHGLVRVVADRAISTPDRSAGTFGRLVQHIEGQLTAVQGRQSQFAVMIVGVDQLAAINHRYGYDAADQVLAALTDRLRNCLRAGDALVRYAGGKFAIVLSNCDSDRFGLLSRRILQSASSAPAPIGARLMSISASVGAALAPRHGRNALALLQRAEEAYEIARQSGVGRAALFGATLALRKTNAHSDLTSDKIAAAVKERRLVVAYQPVAPTGPNLPRHYQASARLCEDAGDPAGAKTILPNGEWSGLIGQIDQRVLEIAVRRLVAEPNLHISVSASAAAFFDPNWIACLAGAIGGKQGPADRLIVEVAESSATSDLAMSLQILDKIRALSARTAVVGFGAGHMSFHDLSVLGVDIVKIDGAFIQNIARCADDRFFVRTLVDLARRRGLRTAAEWVEDSETARLLTVWGVDYLQGGAIGLPETMSKRAPAAAPALAARVA